MFKRKLYETLCEWKKVSNGKTALLIEGARRTGKSTIAEAFAQREYKDYAILDFSLVSNEVKENFENIGDIDTFFQNLFLLLGKRTMPKRESLIIFDEVQLFPKARQAIKHLVKDGRYDYLETGSLISIKKNVKNILIPSEERRLFMYPMDFEEFLWACGEEYTSDAIREAYTEKKPFSEGIHRKMMQLLRTYIAVGGMPQAVDAYVRKMSFIEIDEIKRTILQLYEDDLVKYDEETNNRASAIFKTIPEQLENHNSHFKMSMVDKNARFQNYVDGVNGIEKSMIGNLCLNVTAPETALSLYADQSNFKLYLGDTGLLVTQMLMNGNSVLTDLYTGIIFGKDTGFNRGMIFENLVAQMLKAAGYNLFFHEYYYQSPESNKENKYEIDFLLVKNKHICPIEVKSTNRFSCKSFNYFIKKYPIKITERIIISPKNLSFENGITFLPIYMTFCLQNNMK